MKTTTNRFNKKPNEEFVRIPKVILSSWFKTLKEVARKPRFVTMDDPDNVFLESLIEQERRNFVVVMLINLRPTQTTQPLPPTMNG